MMRLSLALGVAVLTIASCSDATEPSLVGVQYALETIGGDALPTNSIVNSNVIIVADTITFLEMSETTGRVQHRQTATLPNPEPATVRSVFEESFTRSGNSLGFVPSCGPFGNCVFFPHHGLFDGDELIVTYESDIVRTQRYRRL